MNGSSLLPSSPTIATRFRNRVPAQVRRIVPLYLACVCLVLVVLNADLFGSTSVSRPGRPAKRAAARGCPGAGRGAAAAAAAPGAGGFPKKIWQTWKVDPLAFDPRDAATAGSWTAKNPDYRYEVLTDGNDVSYLEQHYGPAGLDRMDIVDAYRAINATIVKADLLRYLVMYAEGGVYADIDVEAIRPVRRFVPDRYDAEDLDMVIGVEIDQPHFRDHPILGQKSESFCQWTFMSKPQLPVLLRLVEDILAWLDAIARQQGVPTAQVSLDFDQVISGTGPSAFTAAVLGEMNAAAAAAAGPPVTWADFHDLDESKLVGRILVLDVEAFAAGQGHSDSGNHNARGALVKHHYHASNWPSRHPRFSHPVYGEVERCNWDVPCVRQWDADVEAFKSLPAEEQQQKIAAKQEELKKLQELEQQQQQQQQQQGEQQQQPIAAMV